MSQVDLSQLALDRSAPPQLRGHTRFRLLTRYLLPGTLLIGFAALIAYASRDLIFPPQPVTVMPVIVSQAQVRSAGTPLFQAAGWVEPRPTPIRVAALAPGVVEELLVVEDQKVKQGEPIARLVKVDAELSLKNTIATEKLREAELQQARATLKAAEVRLSQPVHLEAVLSSAQAELAKIQTQLRNLPFMTRRAKADLEFARLDFERKKSARGAVTQRSIDESKTEVESTTAAYEELMGRKDSLVSEQKALQARCQALQTELILLTAEQKARDEAQAQVAAAAARLEQSQVAVDQARLALERMTIRAPVAGRVYQLVAHPGSSVGNMLTQMTKFDGSTVVTMYRPEWLQIRVDVRFEDIPKVALNQPVQIDNPALSEPVRGSVLFISSEADIQKNTLQVKVKIDEPTPLLKPEMLVDVTFLAPEHEQTEKDQDRESRIYVPRNMVQQNAAGQSCVWVADQSRQVARQQVIETSPQANGPLLEVTQGLNVSSRLIASPTSELQPDERITITGETNHEGN
ncbi:Type I secretion system membrane fusion protein PrsE [Gimesia chilikensis]|uniref:Type I secretion system membrane fusion protein PrsE n=1 Tax=Gimesia chilikensis TaxID=2605989 RepID=A0A517WEE8_9PLAN|nr:efflux RND transporter periplasmic adaptor subunit [Gimesia chilikensis]QDU03625.1 Type I secretion system membrane fusion protein PrsE [Gimesia chilikensis]